MKHSPYVERVNSDQPERWAKRPPPLGHLDIELTERCNSNCAHCYIALPAGDPAARAQEMTTGRVKEILTEAADLGCLSVRFTGGEPLLREDFDEIYVFARKLGIRVTLFTNARLITPALAGLFARTPPGRPVQVSVYGMKPESYEAVSRVPGSYAEFRRGVELLLENRVPFIVKGVLLPPNQGEIDEFEAWAAAIPGMKDPPGVTTLFNLRARRDSPARNRLIADLRPAPGADIAVLNRRREPYLLEMQQFCARFLGPPGDRLFGCGAGHGVCVDSSGRLQACMLLRDPATVCTGTLTDALTVSFPRLRELKAANPDYLRRCARCFLKSLCEQCPAHSWMEHGTLDTPVEYLCRVAHTRARDLGLLGEDEKAWEVADWRSRVARLEQGRG